MGRRKRRSDSPPELDFDDARQQQHEAESRQFVESLYGVMKQNAKDGTLLRHLNHLMPRCYGILVAYCGNLRPDGPVIPKSLSIAERRRMECAWSALITGQIAVYALGKGDTDTAAMAAFLSAHEFGTLRLKTAFRIERRKGQKSQQKVRADKYASLWPLFVTYRKGSNKGWTADLQDFVAKQREQEAPAAEKARRNGKRYKYRCPLFRPLYDEWKKHFGYKPRPRAK